MAVTVTEVWLLFLSTSNIFISYNLYVAGKKQQIKAEDVLDFL